MENSAFKESYLEILFSGPGIFIENDGSVLVNDFWTPSPLLSIFYMPIYFSANLLLFIFLLFRVRLG